MMSGRAAYSNRVSTGIGNGYGMDATAIHTESTYFNANKGNVGSGRGQAVGQTGSYSGYGVAAFLIAWIVLTIIIYFIIWAFRFDFCRKRDSHGDSCDDVDCGRTLLWAIFIALIILIIFWVIAAGLGGAGCGWKQC